MVDVLVIGGGNAALCAALMAREAGASVMLLEGAPKIWRGGNSQHTRNLRCMHDAPQDVLVDAYPEEEYWQDLLKVTGGITNEKLARIAIRASSSCRDWMRRHGVHFQPPLSGALHVARTNAFFMGGGKALVNAYFRSAEKLGVQVRYDTPVVSVELDGDRFVAVHTAQGERIAANSCVLAAKQPGQVGYSIIDQTAIGRFMPPVFPGTTANTLPELARKLGLPEPAFVKTVEDYNAACRPGSFDHTALDDCRTAGITPAK